MTEKIPAEQIYQRAVAVIGEEAIARLHAVGLVITSNDRLRVLRDDHKAEAQRLRDLSEGAMRAAGATAMRVEMQSDGERLTQIIVTHPSGDEAMLAHAVIRLMHASGMIKPRKGTRCPTLDEVRAAMQPSSLAAHSAAAIDPAWPILSHADFAEIEAGLSRDPLGVARRLLVFARACFANAGSNDRDLGRTVYTPIRYLLSDDAVEFDRLRESSKRLFQEAGRDAYNLGFAEAIPRFTTAALRLIAAAVQWVRDSHDANLERVRQEALTWDAVAAGAPLPEDADETPLTPAERALIHVAMRERPADDDGAGES